MNGTEVALPRRSFGQTMHRCLVVTTALRFSRTRDVYRLLNLGGISGNPLSFWQLYLAFLFAGNFRRFAAQLVRTKTRLVARVVGVFAGAFDFMGDGRISA